MARIQKKSFSALDVPMDYRSFFDLANILLIVLDTKGRVAMVNPKGCEILGHLESFVVGQDWFKTFLPTPDRRKTLAVFKKLMKGTLEPVALFKNRIITKNGKSRMMLWHNTYLKDSCGNIRYTYSAGADITGIGKKA
jgi:PAS domain S-box-containing protein